MIGHLNGRQTLTGFISPGQGTDVEKDYNNLVNLPSINSVTLMGVKSFGDLGMRAMTNLEILNIINRSENNG